MHPLAENIYMTDSLYHNYRGNHIIDNGLKSSLFFEDYDLRSSGRSMLKRLLPDFHSYQIVYIIESSYH